MKYKLLLFIFLVVTLGYSVLGALGYDNTKLPRVSIDTSSCLCSPVGGNSSFNSTYADATYLKLTADNDPLTGDLEINKDTPFVTFVDGAYAGTYTGFGFEFGTPTWYYFNGETFDRLYFGGQTFIMEAEPSGGFTMTAQGITWNPRVLGGNQEPVDLIAPFVSGGSNLNGSTFTINSGKSTGAGTSKVVLAGVRGRATGTDLRNASSILEATGLINGGARVDIVNATLNVTLVQWMPTVQVTCNAANEGLTYYNNTVGVRGWFGCNSTTWKRLDN